MTDPDPDLCRFAWAPDPESVSLLAPHLRDLMRHRCLLPSDHLGPHVCTACDATLPLVTL